MSPAISIKNVSKRFRLYHERHTSLKERLINIGKRSYDDFLALNDVSFDVEEGQTFGLMGHNGSGKSTLLKIIGGILQPSAGEIVTKGRIAALLELGAGMQPDLTGRENIFLNGSILGLSRKELEKRFDEIVAFSELEKFIDTQVRFYSSGMYVRLGFAVAVNVDPDILLVDEVLAVGDELFQRKCLERVKQFQREGRTIVVVTHSVDQIRKIANSAAVLDHGNLVYSGEPSKAIREFREKLFDTGHENLNPAIEALIADGEKGLTKKQIEDEKVKIAKAGLLSDEMLISEKAKQIKITGAAFVNPDDATSSHIMTGGSLRAQISWKVEADVVDPIFLFEVYDVNGNMVFEASTKEDYYGTLSGMGNIWFKWESIPLADGTYTANVGITSRDGGVVYDWVESEYKFEVTNENKSFGMLSLPAETYISKIEDVDG